MIARASLIALALVACAAPEGPPGPPDSLTPARPSANDCPPAGAPLFPQRERAPNGWLADLAAGRSCGIYLEQDECVVALFDDCTDDSRQWIGRTRRLSMGPVEISIEPFHDPAPPLAPPDVCTGVFDEPNSPRAAARLSCTGTGPEHAGLYLEKYDPDATAFAEQLPLEQWPIVSFQTVDAIPSATYVENEGLGELWLTVDWDGGGMGGGVWRHSGPPTGPRTRVDDDTSNAYLIDAAPPGGKVIFAFGDRSHRVRVIDPETRMGVDTATVSHEVVALAAATEDRFLVATATAAVVFQLVAGRLVRLPHRFRAANGHTITVADFTAPAGAGAAEFVIATSTGDDSKLYGLNADLSVRWATDVITKFDVHKMITLPDKQRVGLILWGGGRDFEGPDQSNQYHELDPSNGARGEVVAVPYFADLFALSYDADRDRVYVGNRFGYITFVDRVTRRASPGFVRISEPSSRDTVTISEIVWDPRRERLFVVDPRRGVVDSFRILPKAP